jgi:L-aspartate oxidase
MDYIKSDVLIIGGGISGCVTALKAASHNLDVSLVIKGKAFTSSNTYYAQGGIVYTIGKNDSQQLLKDILLVGDGASYPPAVEILVNEGPKLVKDLLIDDAQVPFDTNAKGELEYTEEAAHSTRRIIHVADFTGNAIENGLIKLIKENKHIQLFTDHIVIDLLTEEHHTNDPLSVYRNPTCLGAYIFDLKKRRVEGFLAKVTILATGGLGRIYLYTTNYEDATGDGFAMASRAGADLINMEYIQFHPTAFCYRDRECFLISESLRGEGARLKNLQNETFMEKYHSLGSLAPRDIVSRAIYQEMLDNNYPYVYLDAASYLNADKLKERFPTIYNECQNNGIDITTQPIPVVPAAHFACGGVKVDLWGRTSIDKLFAIGEVSCTGIHGANRLASTSLLECLVWGDRAVRKMIEDKNHYFNNDLPKVREWIYTGIEDPDPALIHQDMRVLRYVMWNYVGLVRTKERLKRALEDLRHLEMDVEEFYRDANLTKQLIELRNAIRTGLLVTHSAWLNGRSRGCHYRKS